MSLSVADFANHVTFVVL